MALPNEIKVIIDIATQFKQQQFDAAANKLKSGWNSIGNSIEVDLFSKAFKSLSSSVSNASSGFKELEGAGKSSFDGLTSSALKLGAALGALSLVFATIKKGIDFNAAEETNAVALKATIASVYKAVGENGKELPFAEQLKNAGKVAEDTMAKIKVIAANSTLTVKELSDATLQAMAVGGQAKMLPEQALKFGESMAKAVKTFGLSGNQMITETRQLLSGNNIRSSQVASSLGITAADIKLMKEQGKLYDYLMDKLKAFQATTADVNATWSGTWDNLSNKASLFFGTAFKEASTKVKTALNDSVSGIFDSNGKVTKEYEGFFKLVEGMATGVGVIISDVFAGIATVTKSISKFMSDNSDTVKIWEVKFTEIWETLKSILPLIFDIAKGILTSGNAVSTVNVGLALFKTIVEGIRAGVAAIGIAFSVVGGLITNSIDLVKLLIKSIDYASYGALNLATGGLSQTMRNAAAQSKKEMSEAFNKVYTTDYYAGAKTVMDKYAKSVVESQWSTIKSVNDAETEAREKHFKEILAQYERTATMKAPKPGEDPKAGARAKAQAKEFADAERLFEDAQKRFENNSDKYNYNEKLDEYKKQLNYKLISDKDYLDKKNRLDTDMYNEQIAREKEFQASVVELRERLLKAGFDARSKAVEKYDAAILRSQDKINAAQSKIKISNIDFDYDVKILQDKLNKEKVDVKVQLLADTAPLESQLMAIEQKYKDLLKNKNLDPEGKADLEALKQKEILKARATESSRKQSEIDTNIGLKKAQLNADLEKGKITQMEYDSQLYKLNEQNIDSVKRLTEAYIELLSQDPKNTALLSGLTAAQTKLAEMESKNKTYIDEIKKSFSDATADALVHFKNLRTFTTSILTSVGNMMQQHLVKDLSSAIKKGLDSGDGIMGTLKDWGSQVMDWFKDLFSKIAEKLFAQKAATAAVSAFADGGLVTGSGGSKSDSVPAVLSAGEVVIPVASAQKFGYDRLLQIVKSGTDTQHFADGGIVSAPSTFHSDVSTTVSPIVVMDPSDVASALAKTDKMNAHIVKVAVANKNKLR